MGKERNTNMDSFVMQNGEKCGERKNKVTKLWKRWREFSLKGSLYIGRIIRRNNIYNIL
jgi:hypothetical protein